MDSRTGFSKVILGHPARHPTELLQVYAGMLAHGSSMDASDISLMIPQLTANQVLGGRQWFDNKDAVRAANERKLYVPSSMRSVPISLRPLVLPEVSLKQIALHWDNLVRLAASIETGHASATVALARYGSASSDSPMYRAGMHLGRLVRSIYLCDYLASEKLRREIHRILVHGEAVHTLQRAICAGSFSKPRGRQESELYAASGSLTLMTNLCLAWTAAKMQEKLFGDRVAPLSPQDIEWLAYVSPAHFSNINFRGIFSFPLEQYEGWLFARAA